MQPVFKVESGKGSKQFGLTGARRVFNQATTTREFVRPLYCMDLLLILFGQLEYIIMSKEQGIV